MSPRTCALAAVALLTLVLHRAVLRAADDDPPFFKKGDVIAFVGGEDMVALSEYGYVELLLHRALPDFQLRFRDLAWEGDTVFEQRRDLNFPPLETQLDQVGATVVICQFGQMESLAGTEKLPEFIAAYEKLIARMRGGGKRRVAIVTPHSFAPWIAADVGPALDAPRETDEGRENLLHPYLSAIKELSERLRCRLVDVSGEMPLAELRNGVHLNSGGQLVVAIQIGNRLAPGHDSLSELSEMLDSNQATGKWDRLWELLHAKNRLWFNYWRVQNWAFLAGDRTEQPSSRDHLDRSKRWFPAEREEFLGLIAQKEQEIQKLAAHLIPINIEETTAPATPPPQR